MAGSRGAHNYPFLAVEDYAKLVGFLLGAVAFITLIGLDLRKAIKNGAYWVPGRAVVLSALTLQIMNFTQNQSVLLDKVLEGSGSLSNEVLKENLFMIHISRVMLCVLIAFFLPGMARHGYQEKWTKIGAIGLTVFIDIFSEVISVHNRTVGSRVVSHSFYSWTQSRQVSEISFFVSGAIISITLIWLNLLLICAAIACKRIRTIISQKIPIIIAEPADRSWKGVEDQVLKSWIVVRACCPESTIARSVLASSAALGVTICILSSVLGWIILGPKVKFHPKPVFCLKFITTILQMIFILIGWAIIGWRWISSVALYGRKRKDFFRVEDYWTSHIADLQEAEDLKLRELKVDERISKMFVTKWRKPKVDERESKMIAKEKKGKTSLVSIWLSCVFWLQWYVVFFSKLCWFLSVRLFGNTVIRKVVKWIISSRFQKAKNDFNDYKEILNSYEFFDQSTDEVILTNLKSIKQAKGIMTKGNNDGENCHSIVPFLRDWGSVTYVDMQYLDPEKALSQTGLKFLWRHHPVTPLKEEKYLKYGRKRSLKLTAVSLINVIVWLSPLSERYSLQAYCEAGELIDLVDQANSKTDDLLSKAADRLLTEILYPESESEKEKKKKQRPAATMCEAAAADINDIVEAEKAIRALASDMQNDANDICIKIEHGEDTVEDWEKLAAYNALYKLCLSIDYTNGDLEGLKHELKRSLGYIISCYVRNVGPALVDNCRKWAQGSEKRKLLEAVYIAGKSRGLFEKLGWDSDVQIPTEAAQQGWSENMGNGQATEDSHMV